MVSILGAQLAVKLNLCPAQCQILNRILYRNFCTVHKLGRFALERHLHNINSNHCHKLSPSTRTEPCASNSCLLQPRCLVLLQQTAKHSLAGGDYDDTEQGDGEHFKAPVPDFDWDYLCNPDNSTAIRENIDNRKGVGDIDVLLSLWKKIQQLRQRRESEPEDAQLSLWKKIQQLRQRRESEPEDAQEEELELLRQKLCKAAAEIPNSTHPDVPIGDESQARLIETCGQKREFNFKPKTVVDLASRLDILRTENTGLTTGLRTYYFKGPLAQMEQALIRYTVDALGKKGFDLMSVPDLIHPTIIEGCGFSTTGDRTQVYRLEPSKHGDVCLAGTGEMPLAGYFTNSLVNLEELPQKVMTVSRCFRAETSTVEEERGIYRVHQFTKVEMFVVTANETGHESDDLLEELRSIERDLFSRLGIHFRMLDMPSQELGAPACRKYDMETWMPAKQFWGEISSTSNCSDFQSRRLNIKYTRKDGQIKHAHTVNGTACAVPRMLMTLIENGQNEDGNIHIPEALQPYMDGMTVIEKFDKPLILRWNKLRNVTKRQAKQS